MADVAEHYKNFLSEYYTWFQGGREKQVEKNLRFFKERKMSPSGCARAVDLGAGSGFQSIPLVRLGYHVTAIDLSEFLLEEIEETEEAEKIELVCGNILEVDRHLNHQVELATCMGDTITHLPSLDDVRRLMKLIHKSLEPGGSFVITYRDLSRELVGLERILPVQSDDDTIFTCFLEYDGPRVRVTDIVHVRTDRGWKMQKSDYFKLRIPLSWLEGELKSRGFEIQTDDMDGLSCVVAKKVIEKPEKKKPPLQDSNRKT